MKVLVFRFCEFGFKGFRLGSGCRGLGLRNWSYVGFQIVVWVQGFGYKGLNYYSNESPKAVQMVQRSNDVEDGTRVVDEWPCQIRYRELLPGS